MFSHIKTNFEQTLRARIFPVAPKQDGNNPGLNPDFHRGCTGKAHACGTAKSRLANSNNNNTSTAAAAATTTSNTSVLGKDGKKAVQRKNSISSETISDSGSENSAPSWLDTTDCVANGKVAKSSSHNCIGGGKTPEVKKRLMQLKKHNCSEHVSIISKNSGKLLARKSPTPTASNADRRRRLYSEGDRMSETGASNASTSSINVTTQQQQHYNRLKQQQRSSPQQESTFERIQKYRSFRVGNNSLRKALKTSNSTPATTTRPLTPNGNGNIRPPWNSGTAHKINMSLMSPTLNARKYRNSFRRRDVVDWTTIWERSFALRGAAAAQSGCYKNYNEAIKRKVCIQFQFNNNNKS